MGIRCKFALVLLLTCTAQASAVVVRHDVEETRYRANARQFPALVDFPGEGHGVLLSPRWVVTAAHVVSHPLGQVTINGLPRAVARVIIHPGYKPLTPAGIARALESRDATDAMRGQTLSDDIALIELVDAVSDVAPALMAESNPASGELVQILGKGATGNGETGQRGAQRTELRYAFSHLNSVDAKWLTYRFKRGNAAHPLEGMSGGGDSGGPLLVQENGNWRLAAIAAFKYVEGDPTTFKPGVYGQLSYNLRVSYYRPWIAQITGRPSFQRSGRLR